MKYTGWCQNDFNVQGQAGPEVGDRPAGHQRRRQQRGTLGIERPSGDWVEPTGFPLVGQHEPYEVHEVVPKPKRGSSQMATTDRR